MTYVNFIYFFKFFSFFEQEKLMSSIPKDCTDRFFADNYGCVPFNLEEDPSELEKLLTNTCKISFKIPTLFISGTFFLFIFLPKVESSKLT